MKAKCRCCREWFTTVHGMYVSLPRGYDTSMCGPCNRRIEREEEEREAREVTRDA